MSEYFPIISISLAQKSSTVTNVYHNFLVSTHFRLLFYIGVVNVAKFREDDPEQDYIPPQTFYRRYTFEYKARRLQVNTIPSSHKIIIVYSLLFPFNSLNLDHQHVFVRPLTCLKTPLNRN